MLTVGPLTGGCRTYLAVRGGIAVAPVLGSRSTDTLTGLGPPALVVGSRLPVGHFDQPWAGTDFAPATGYPTHRTLGVHPAPRPEYFTDSATQRLFSSVFTVSPDSNRVALRLIGRRLARAAADELPSEGLVTGAIQLPPSEQPILFLNDDPTTGGYPIIGMVATADLPRQLSCVRATASGSAPSRAYPSPERSEAVLDSFDEFDVDVNGTTIHGRRGGDGPPLLLLHGIPETHLMWHRVAPMLAEWHTVVMTDLRGYGGSGTPPSSPDHSRYAMRELARDQVGAMRELGHATFAVAGHDRGARCAYRMALDSPDIVERLAVLDIVPTGEAFRRADKDFSVGYWVWTFLAAPEPVPERLIGADPAVLVDHMLDSWAERRDVFPPALRARYLDQFTRPEQIHAICEQYRAAATLDCEHDEADRGVRKISCPVLALWSASGAVQQWYDPIEVWREWATDVQGRGLDAGHFLPEEAPDEVAKELLNFFAP